MSFLSLADFYNTAVRFKALILIRVNLGCCEGNGKYAHIIVVYNINRALKSTAGQITCM